MEASRRLHIQSCVDWIFSILPLQSALRKHGLKIVWVPILIHVLLTCTIKNKSAFFIENSEATFFFLCKKNQSSYNVRLLYDPIWSFTPSFSSSPRCKVTQVTAVLHTTHAQWEYLGTKQIMLRIRFVGCCSMFILWLLLRLLVSTSY